MISHLTLLLPDDILVDLSKNEHKTQLIGMLGRALAIFKVDEIIIFKSPFISDVHRGRDRKLIQALLSYLETPQYLRKQLFPLQWMLKFVGLLQPLATPHHQTTRELHENEIRDGLLFLQDGQLFADIGSWKPIAVTKAPPRSFDTEEKIRAPIQVHYQGGWVGELIDPAIARKIQYMGYSVRLAESSLPKYLKSHEKYIIFTSTKGKMIENIDFTVVKQEIKDRPVVIVFGSAKHGLLDYLKPENKTFHDVADITVNTWSDPGTRTIRLEEAIYISLARILPNIN